MENPEQEMKNQFNWKKNCTLCNGIKLGYPKRNVDRKAVYSNRSETFYIVKEWDDETCDGVRFISRRGQNKGIGLSENIIQLNKSD